MALLVFGSDFSDLPVDFNEKFEDEKDCSEAQEERYD